MRYLAKLESFRRPLELFPSGQQTEAAKTVFAVASGLGGFVLFGVGDKGEIVGQQVATVAIYDDHLETINTGLVHGQFFDHQQRQEHAWVDAVADEIKERFGHSALRRGSNLRGESPWTP
jgi:hypothetical protein